MKQICCWAIALLACLLTACEQKELCYDHSHTADLKVVFDWRNDPAAQPASMRLYLFPEEGGLPLLYEFAGREGGTITVPAGFYHAVGLNSDTEFILYRNQERYEQFEASLTGGTFSRPVPRAEGTDTQDVRSTPDRLWSDHTDEVEVKASVPGQVLVLYPKLSVCRYTVEIHNVANLKYLTRGEIFGSLTSMAGGLMMSTGLADNETVTLPFDMTSDRASNIYAEFYTFGYPAASTAPQYLMVYAILNDGKKYSFTYDVTAQIHEAPDPKNVHIVLDGLPLPKPIDNGGGFAPTVDDWNTEEVEISM